VAKGARFLGRLRTSVSGANRDLTDQFRISDGSEVSWVKE